MPRARFPPPPCHGSSAQGAPGYPNLTDDHWNWGGTPDRILQTVLDGREGVMAPLGTVLTGMGGDVAITAGTDKITMVDVSLKTVNRATTVTVVGCRAA